MKWIAARRCYVNDQIYEPGQTFEFEGQQGSAFYPVGGSPLPSIDMYDIEGRRNRRPGIVVSSIPAVKVESAIPPVPPVIEVAPSPPWFISLGDWIFAICSRFAGLWKRKVRMRTLTILNGQTQSEELDLRDGVGLLVRTYNFFIPAHGVSVTVYLSTAPGGTFLAVNDGFGNDYVLQASKFQFLHGAKAGAMKLVASAGVTGNQVFTVSW